MRVSLDLCRTPILVGGIFAATGAIARGMSAQDYDPYGHGLAASEPKRNPPGYPFKPARSSVFPFTFPLYVTRATANSRRSRAVRHATPPAAARRDITNAERNLGLIMFSRYIRIRPNSL